MADRLQALELAVRDASSGPDVTGDIVERLKGSLDLKPIAHRLDIIEEALLSREPSSDNGVADRLKNAGRRDCPCSCVQHGEHVADGKPAAGL